jgi:anti-sigma factor RsiW
MQCAESVRAQAYFDRELDSPGAADLERHAHHCWKCCQLLDDLEQLRCALRRELTYMSIPASMKVRIIRALNQSGLEITPVYSGLPRAWCTQPFWRGAFAGIGGVALAAGVSLVLLGQPLRSSLPGGLLSAHVRSLMSEHLIDVESTEKHTVKPWFSSHAGVSPAVADFALQGYKLIGGRADYFDRQRVAVIVYQSGSHVINVFSWVGNRGTLPKSTTRDGYHLAFWGSGDLAYCAISDTGWDELLGLAKLIQELSVRDGQEIME